jgi:hypothetical protein
MIAGLLALMLVSADTTMRIAPPVIDTLTVVVSDLTTSVQQVSGTVAASSAPVVAPSLSPLQLVSGVRAELRSINADTTIKKKRKLVEYSEWYGRRLTLHKALSWTMLPLFAVSYYTGERLARDGRVNSPYWVRAAHPYVATADAVVFGVNTVTGVWNLWDARHDPEGRTRRIIHSVLFIAADAGFAYAGSIGEDARDNGAIRSRHRTVALSSIGVSTLGWVIMLFRN